MSEPKGMHYFVSGRAMCSSEIVQEGPRRVTVKSSYGPVSHMEPGRVCRTPAEAIEARRSRLRALIEQAQRGITAYNEELIALEKLEAGDA